MEKIKEELKLMQSNPNLYLANYFQDLKREVDMTFFGKEGDEKAKYLEIIAKIEEIEQDYYNSNQRNKRFKRDDKEIESLEEQSTDDLKYKLEEKLFKNKTIFFLKDYEYDDEIEEELEDDFEEEIESENNFQSEEEDQIKIKKKK
jgi:hypothetical protein